MRLFRLASVSVSSAIVLLSAHLPAQPDSKPQSQPTSQPTSQPAGNAVIPEEAPRELTPQERLSGLQATLDKLKAEKARLLKIEKIGLGSRAQERFKTRNIYGDPNRTEMGPPKAKAKHARLLGDAERRELPADVIFTVNSMPVTTKEFDDLFDYLRSYPRPDAMGSIKTEVILNLVHARAAQAAAKDNLAKALAVAKKIHADLKSGGSFKSLAKEHSQDAATAAKGGDLGYITREHTDKLVTRTLFNLSLGEVSGVVRGRLGFYIVRTRGYKKGATADKDRVRGSSILVRYASETTLKQVAERVASADVDVAFRDKELREFAPGQFK